MSTRKNFSILLSTAEWERFWGLVDCSAGPGECWPWLGHRGREGYGEMRVGRRPLRAHRIAIVYSLGTQIPDGLHCLHSCDNPRCCNPAHLRIGTDMDNKRDCIERGRDARGETHWTRLHPERLARGDRNGARTHPERLSRGAEHYWRRHPEARLFGEKNGRAKISTEGLALIFSLRSQGKFLREIAEAVGLGKTQVSRILRCGSWSNTGSVK